MTGGLTGTDSYHTKIDRFELMFHVAELLPFVSGDAQQVLRKRHIGNDIVTFVFLASGAPAFSPVSFVSNFQRVFIVVRHVGEGVYK